MQADVVCRAEDLPFAEGSFDVVACRLAPHHFEEVQAGISEMARVSRGLVLVVDNLWMGEDDEDANRLRDPSHVRNYSEDEWRELFDRAGLEVEELRTMEVTLRFQPWLERTGTSAEDGERIRELIGNRVEGDLMRLGRIALKGRAR
jgi:SAM-dependent methyltransferase